MPCPICGCHDAWPIPFSADRQIDAWRAECGDRSPYRWRLCQGCGNAYPSSQPDLRILSRLWESNRAVGPAERNEADTIWAYRQAISRSGAERSHRLFSPLASGPPGRFLDVACGLGETVRLFESRGWTAEGIDADASTQRFHRQLGIRTRIGQFETLAVDDKYDLIHIAHAIYFITDPMTFLKAVRARLNPGGLFCVVLSDFMSVVDNARPSYAHTFYPVAASMRRALALAGFEVVLTRARSGSIYIAAQPAADPATPPVWPRAIRMAYQTKRLRYLVLGRPYLALRGLAKRLLRRT